MIEDLKEKYGILDNTFGIIKTEKSGRDLKVEVYEEISDFR